MEKNISNQIHEFENTIYDMKVRWIKINESILFTSLIKILPLSWSNFARGLKQKPKNFTSNELLVGLRIEDKHHFSQKQA